MIHPDTAAIAVLDSLSNMRPIAPFTDADPGFDLGRSYDAALSVMRMREARGERVVGGKLGFTNRTIWDEYNVHAPVWGPVYDTTTGSLEGPVDVGAFLEPRIEPEIIFRLSGLPGRDATPEAAMACVSHVALGFEIVQSVYPGWRFRAPDTVAAFALHGRLLHGPFQPVGDSDRADWTKRLTGFSATLERDGTLADTGDCRNVLGGGPLAALTHLAALLEDFPKLPRPGVGAVFTTGTLTRALPVARGETWTAKTPGLPFEPVSLTFR